MCFKAVREEMAKNELQDREETMDEGTSTYLMQAKQEQHNILYLNYKQLQLIPRALVAGDDFRCIKQLYLRNNRLKELVRNSNEYNISHEHNSILKRAVIFMMAEITFRDAQFYILFNVFLF